MSEKSSPRVGIEEFLKGLQGLRDFGSEFVFPYIKDHPLEAESLSPFLFFSPTSYTRNLVFQNEWFEVLALCWEVGQVSRVHNHRDQQCWMAVTMGRLKNQNYRVLDHNPEKLTCRMEPTRIFVITPTAPLEVDPQEPVHQVLNLTEYGERAVSLHVYSQPIPSCEVYLPNRGTYSDVDLHFTSEFGRLCDGETAVRP